MKQPYLLLFVSLLPLVFCVEQDTGVALTERKIIININTALHSSAKGIVYFSSDNGNTWEDKSNGLPDDIFLTEIAVSDKLLGLSTKQNGVFLFNFQKNSWESILNNPPTSANLDAVFFHKNKILAGTQNEGIFTSIDNGKNWISQNEGLGNLTIRRFGEVDDKLYVGTDDGLYFFNEQENKWDLEYGHNLLQVNGITTFGNEIYIGTNQGAFKKVINHKVWKQILADRSLHNISTDDKTVYALVYNELFASTDKGKTWYSDQKGMPDGKYSFEIVQLGKTVLAAQWDGIYKKEFIKNWTPTNTGLPAKFPVTEMKIYKNMVIAASSGWVTK